MDALEGGSISRACPRTMSAVRETTRRKVRVEARAEEDRGAGSFMAGSSIAHLQAYIILVGQLFAIVESEISSMAAGRLVGLL